MIPENIPGFVPAIWAGIECSYNRVGDRFSDQLDRSGHYRRPDDIERFAELGIKALHYPLLWERHQTAKNASPQWDWASLQLEKLRSRSILPIVGLLHHGSGPAFTDLLDDEFASGLSAFAKQTAGRFPWITHYKPINEPLTTARFAGLYGLWHPHAKNDAVFAKILLHQLKAIVLSMQEIRKVNPEAKLIQTEDLAKTYSTPLLHYQAEFENHRRWLTYDFLTGKFNRHHPLWEYFIGLGIKEKTLLFFSDNPCPPDLLGVNHYVTSERYLDHQLAVYPAHLHGGNGRDAYVDVEAIRVNHGQMSGLNVLLKELHERYSIDIALTEVHLHCTREEQLRWLKHVWDTCLEFNREKPAIKAFTAWSLLGAYGWDQLLTQPVGNYESGVFDLRSPTPRPTALAHFVEALCNGKEYHHPVVHQKGWWEKESRFTHSPLQSMPQTAPVSSLQPLLIIGKDGTLGRAFGICCQQRGIEYQFLDRKEMYSGNQAVMEDIVRRYRPWAVINTTGYMPGNNLENHSPDYFHDTIIGLNNLASACAKYGVKLLTFSSAMVFDGTKTGPYIESDEVTSSDAYGHSKAQGEKAVLAGHRHALVIRTGVFFSPWDAISTMIPNSSLPHPDSMLISPAYVPDVVHMALDLLIDDESGIWHLANEGKLLWSEFVSELGLRTEKGIPFPESNCSQVLHRQVKRPGNWVLGSEKGLFLPPLHQALERYFTSRKTG